MSFSSMLQMARGRDPPEPQLPQSNSAKEKDAASMRGAAKSAGSKQPQQSTSASSLSPPVKVGTTGNSQNTSGTQKSSPTIHQAAPSKNMSANSKPRPTPSPLGRSAPKTAPTATMARPVQGARSSPRQPTNVATSTAANKSQSNNARASTTTPSPRTPPSSGASGSIKKKLSFKDVMNQASNINTSKLEVKLRMKDSRKQPEPAAPRRPRLKPASSDTKAPEKTPSRSSPAAPSQNSRRREPAPVAQPFPEVLGKRQRQLEARRAPSKRRLDDDDDDDLSDFIASEEEEEETPSGSHEDIWRLFNRGPKQRYVDYDSDDDMEARGDEILNEERRSALQARREDAEEERKLAELARRKQQQRKRS